MASRTPAAAGAAAGAVPYLAAWAATRRLLEDGNSWSGHERHCAYVNDGHGRFLDVSSVSGLDLPGDGRAVAATDWDGDGDVDLWFRQRSGPQLALMRNDVDRVGGALWLRLRGTASNRDAVGARVEVTAGGRTAVRVVAAGDGYLAQSSRWLHVATGSAARVERAVVSWPGGAVEAVSIPTPDGRYEIVEGSGRAVPVAAPAAGAFRAAAEQPLRPTGVETDVLLRVPLALPGPLGASIGAGDAPVWIAVWAEWCEPCRGELRELAAAAGRLREAGVRVVALNVDRGAAATAARAWFDETIGHDDPTLRFVAGDDRTVELLDALLRHVTGRKRDGLPLPLGLLVDPAGDLQLLRLGAAEADAVLAAATRFTGPQAPRAAFRGLHGGRWYFRARRDPAWLGGAVGD